MSCRHVEIIFQLSLGVLESCNIETGDEQMIEYVFIGGGGGGGLVGWFFYYWRMDGVEVSRREHSGKCSSRA